MAVLSQATSLSGQVRAVRSRLCKVPKQTPGVSRFGGQNNIQSNLYQLVTIPVWMQAGGVTFWVKITAPLIDPGSDAFCARLYSALPTNPHTETGQLDMGCVTGTYQGAEWRKTEYRLFGPEIDRLRGTTLYLFFYFESDGTAPTTVLLDDVSFSVSDESGNLHEPNNSPSTATRLISGNTVTDLTISPDWDIDWFVVSGQAGQHLTVYIYAAAIGSPLNSQVLLYDGSLKHLAAVNGQPSSPDPLLFYDLPANSDYYFVVSPYDGHGGPDYYYQIAAYLSNFGSLAPPSLEGSPSRTSPKLQSSSGTKEWTFMYYLDLDDRKLSATRYNDIVSRYLKELRFALTTKDSLVNVLVLADGPGNGDTFRFTVHPLVPATQEYMGELNMGDPNSLKSFVSWSMQNYPAQHYMLQINGHASGVKGIASDDFDGQDALDPRELRNIVDSITAHGALKIDLLFFEGCTMGLYEVAYDMRNYANFLVASESIFNTYSDHTYMADGLWGMHSGLNAIGLGSAIMQGIANFGKEPEAVALIDLSQMSAVASAVSSLFVTQLAPAASGDPTLLSIRSSTQIFDATLNGNDIADPYLDLWDLADRIDIAYPNNEPVHTRVQAVKQAVQAAVVSLFLKSEGCGISLSRCYDHAHGLSIYWPYRKDYYYSKYTDERFALFEVTAYGKGTYDNFLKWLFDALSLQGSVMARRGLKATSNWSLSSPGLPLAPDMPGAIWTSLYLPLIRR